MFTQIKPPFAMECLAHVIYGALKAIVVDVKFEDGSLDISSTRAKMNKNIMWTKKSQKGSVALIQEQKQFKIENVRLIAPSKFFLPISCITSKYSS